MNLWWKHANPLAGCRSEGLTIPGDPGMPTKRNPLWRMIWDYHVLEDKEFRDGDSYRLAFGRNGFVGLEFRRLIKTKYVAARVGPDPVTFWSHGPAQSYLQARVLLHTGIVGRGFSIFDQGIHPDKITFV